MNRATSGRYSCFCLSSLILDTLTGISAAQDSFSSPRSYARRHLNSWFAFMPCARATSATLAPGLNVNCTIASFSEAVRQRRTRRTVLNNPSAMCRSLPSALRVARRERPDAYPVSKKHRHEPTSGARDCAQTPEDNSSA